MFGVRAKPIEVDLSKDRRFFSQEVLADPIKDFAGGVTAKPHGSALFSRGAFVPECLM